MRKVVAILLILVLLTPVLGKLGVWLHYQANLRYYAEVLCENQDKPDLNCDGHCVLAQRLAATNPQPPAAPSAQLFQFELPAFMAEEPLQQMVALASQMLIRYFCAVDAAAWQSLSLGVEAPPPDDWA